MEKQTDRRINDTLLSVSSFFDVSFATTKITYLIVEN